MLLYHLMADEGVLPDKVIPQVPQNLMQGEDQSIPRICVGQSLDDCLTGIPVTGITIPFLLAEVKRAGAKQAWKKDFQFPFIIRTYCAECNNSAFFDERKVSHYVWDAEITHECWLTEYSEPLRIEKRWLTDATIEKRRFLHDGEWWTYPIISNSVWSDTPAYPNPVFRKKILSMTKKWLEQN